MSTKQLNLWSFQNDTIKYLEVEEYINKEFDELNPKDNFTCTISHGVIHDINIIFGDENDNNILKIIIYYEGQKYINKTSLTKENIEYLCGLAGIEKFNIEEIIGSKIKFSETKDELLEIKETDSYNDGISFLYAWTAPYLFAPLYIPVLMIYDNILYFFLALFIPMLMGWVLLLQYLKSKTYYGDTIFKFEPINKSS